MKEYISTIIYISIFSIILELILPNNKMKKYIVSLIGLLIVIIVSMPVINFFKNEDVILALSTAIDEISFSNETMHEYDFVKQRDRMVSSSVKDKLEEEILSSCNKDLKEYSISKVRINLDDEYKVKEIDVFVKSINDVEDARKIINYITDTYNVKEQVINIIKGE